MTLVESSPAPVLICLNLQRAYTDPFDGRYAPRHASTLIHAGACLSWARRQGLGIWHVHTSGRDASSAPIPGFEPRPDEPLLLKGSWSLFGSTEVQRMRPPLRHAFILGFAAARDCVAAAVEAERCNAQLVFVIDAIASSALPDQPPDTVDAVVGAILDEWAIGVTTAELLRREPQMITA